MDGIDYERIVKEHCAADTPAQRLKNATELEAAAKDSATASHARLGSATANERAALQRSIVEADGVARAARALRDRLAPMNPRPTGNDMTVQPADRHTEPAASAPELAGESWELELRTRFAEAFAAGAGASIPEIAARFGYGTGAVTRLLFYGAKVPSQLQPDGVTVPDEAVLRALYDRFGAIDKVAAHLTASPSVVSAAMRTAGIAVRPRGTHGTPQGKPRAVIDMDVVRRLHNAGLSPNTIAAHLKVDRATLIASMDAVKIKPNRGTSRSRPKAGRQPA